MGSTESDVVVGKDGISVEKSFEPEKFPVPAIAFVVRSERDSAARVRLVDDLPEGVGPEDVGFHPDYGEEHWTVEDHQIVFEREFGPEESYTTVYGLRARDLDSVSRFLSEPTVEAAPTDTDPENGIDDQGEDVPDGIIDTVLALDFGAHAEAEGTVGDEDDDDDGEEEEIVPLELNDPSHGEASGSVPSDGTADGDDAAAVPIDEAERTTGSSPPAGSAVASALAAELRAGDVDEATATTLREHLGIATTDAASGNSVETRIRHVQSGLSDLRAYIDALEAFIDENGDAQQVLGDLRAAVDALDGRVDGVGERVSAVDDRVSAVDERVERTTDWLADVENRTDERLGTVEEGLESADGRADEALEATGDVADGLLDVEVRVDDLRSDLAAIEASLDDLRAEAAVAADVEETAARLDDLEVEEERIEDLTDRLDGLEEEFDRVEGIATRLDGLEADVERIESVADRVGAVESDLDGRLDDIETEVAEFESFRRRMASAFGATGAGDASGADEA